MFDSFSHLNTSARLPRRPHRSLRGHRRSRHLLCGPECPSSDPETSHGLAKCKAKGHYFAWISTEAVTTQHIRGPKAFTKEPRVTQICTALPRSDSVSPGDRGHRKSLWHLLSRAASASLRSETWQSLCPSGPDRGEDPLKSPRSHARPHLELASALYRARTWDGASDVIEMPVGIQRSHKPHSLRGA